MRLLHVAVDALGVNAAQGYKVAALAHSGGVFFQPPAAHLVAAQVAKTGNMPQHPLPQGLGLLRFVIMGKAVNIRAYRQGKAQGIVFAAQHRAGLGGQGFYKNQPHAVGVVRAAG